MRSLLLLFIGTTLLFGLLFLNERNKTSKYEDIFIHNEVASSARAITVNVKDSVLFKTEVIYSHVYDTVQVPLTDSLAKGILKYQFVSRDSTRFIDFLLESPNPLEDVSVTITRDSVRRAFNLIGTKGNDIRFQVLESPNNNLRITGIPVVNTHHFKRKQPTIVPYVGIGLGYDFNTRKLTPNVSLGLGFNINKLLKK